MINKIPSKINQQHSLSHSIVLSASVEKTSIRSVWFQLSKQYPYFYFTCPTISFFFTPYLSRSLQFNILWHSKKTKEETFLYLLAPFMFVLYNYYPFMFGLTPSTPLFRKRKLHIQQDDRIPG